MEEKNKKVIVPTIVAVVTLVLLTVGATYAYFRVATDNAFGTPKIEATTPSIGSVALSTGSNLTMNLTAEEMMPQPAYEGEELQACIEQAKDYGVTPENWGCYYETNAFYSATPEGTVKYYADKIPKNSIGTATATGDETYNCTYTLTINDNANSLYDAFQTYNNKSVGQILLNVNGITYDFNTSNLFPLTIEGKMDLINKYNPQKITARLVLANYHYVDQSQLAGKSISLDFNVTNFSCTAVQEPPLCIRARELHDYLGNIGNDLYSFVSLGNAGTKGAELAGGDALTCDVNGDKVYDEETERFYYVSDYYNTTTKQFENDKATLIYRAGDDYYNYEPSVAYDASGENWHGPVDAIKQLPTISEWTNVSLINPKRAILNEQGGNTVTINGVTHNLPTEFDYSGYSARLLTYQEYQAAENIKGGTAWDMAAEPMYGIGGDYFTESPSSNSLQVYGAQQISANSYGMQKVSASDGWFVRPVIEVYKTDIDN